MNDIDKENAAFWNELCGSQLARTLGVNDDSPESLARFDRWYFDFYPYLDRYISFADVGGKRVLEVGLGYGSVAERLAKSGAVYHGLDIAAGPVAMVHHRLKQNGLSGDVCQGSILECPWPDGTFDQVVAIGCYHHTGNLHRALDETYRVLKPGGGATIMVYNANSYRQWFNWKRRSAADQRRAYDANAEGDAAPETAFTSARELRDMMGQWSQVEIRRENIGGELFLRFVPRRFLLSVFGPWFGLDLYCTAVK